MAGERWHAGEVSLTAELRLTLIQDARKVLHWLACPKCDPDGIAEAMLLCVSWSKDDYLAEVLRDV